MVRFKLFKIEINSFEINLYFFLIITLLFLSSCDSITTSKNPNIVIILADDQGWGDLSVNGNPLVSTPQIDGLGNHIR